MALLQDNMLNEDMLEQVSGGLHGAGTGHWVPAMVTAANGICTYSKEGGNFTENSRPIIPFEECITVDKSRRTGVYAPAIYDYAEVWVNTKKLEWL